jgi:hypothetical protein
MQDKTRVRRVFGVTASSDLQVWVKDTVHIVLQQCTCHLHWDNSHSYRPRSTHLATCCHTGLPDPCLWALGGEHRGAVPVTQSPDSTAQSEELAPLQVRLLLLTAPNTLSPQACLLGASLLPQSYSLLCLKNPLVSVLPPLKFHLLLSPIAPSILWSSLAF